MTKRRRGVCSRVAAGALVAALAVLAAPAARAQFGWFGQNKVRYLDFEWKVYHAPHFDVYYYPEEERFLEPIVSYAESAYLQLGKALDHEPRFRIPLIFYRTHAAFEQTNIILEFIPESVGAFAEPLQKRMVLPIDAPSDKLYQLITHELAHIFEYSLLFQDSAGRAVRGNPPLWLMEGLASHLAEDEDNFDVMIIRDAVVNGLVPPITQVRGLSFLTYRYGHAAFDFIQEEFGPEGVRTFLSEYRKLLLTANIERAIKEAFGFEAEEFDRRFRRYLIKKYLPTLLEKREPEDFGKEVGIKLPGVFTFSPALSPSGDLIAVMTNKTDDLDIFILNAKDGEVIRNLTRGLTRDYDSLTAAIFKGKNDLSWSPGGDEIAVFARRGKDQLLLLFNAVTGKQVAEELLAVEAAESPAFSPDGKRIAFSANKDGVVDIFEYNLETKALANITNDQFYDSNPAWSEDGKTILYNRRINAYEKVFLLEYGDPSQKTQVTFGETSDVQPSFSRDGRRIYYSSDGGGQGIFNIYSLDLETGEIRQFTDVISGHFSPRELPDEEGKQRLVATAFWRLRFRLYTVSQDEPVKVVKPEERAQEPAEIVPFEPALKLTLDETEKRPYEDVRFHVENVRAVEVGVASDSTLFGNANIVFSDLLGDRRIWFNAQTVANFSNFDVGYLNLENRWQWFAAARDQRDFIVLPTSSGNFFREQANRITGVRAGLSYPFTQYTRVQGSLGVDSRDIISSDLFRFRADENFDPNSNPGVDPGAIRGQEFGELNLDTESGVSPIVSASLIHDSTWYRSFGPWHGKRAVLSVASAPAASGDLGTFVEYVLDLRLYQRMTSRSLIAWRLFADVSEGGGSQFFGIGGVNQLRGFRFREFFGDRAAFSNLEVRFPLVDELAFPFGTLREVRGFLFLDVGASWTQDGLFWDKETGFFREFDFYDAEENRLQDGRASYGLGFSFRLGFFELNWSFARRLPFAETRVTAECAAAFAQAVDFSGAAAALELCPLEETDDDSWKGDFYIQYAF